MYAEERRQAMATRARAQGRVAVTALAVEFAITTETVRRDLSALERMGLVRRVHGGAVPADSLRVLEAALGERDRSFAEEKERIAQAAVALLPPSGSIVLLDAGTTTARLAAALPAEHRLTVITHSVPIASRLAGLAHIELHLLPGRVRRTTQAAVGPETIAALGVLRADVAFIGTNGLSVDHGLSTPDRTEAATKQAMIAAGRRVVVVADSGKVGEESPISFARLDQVDVLVTDAGLTDADRTSLTGAGLEVVSA